MQEGRPGIVPPHWEPDRVDEVELIEDGIFAGISTGANVVGSLQLAERLGPEAVIVALAVDSGFKYMGVPPYSGV